MGKRIELAKGQGGWFLRFVASNGKTLSHSEGYATKWNAKRAARKNFPGIPMIEVSRP